jgi:protein TonB
VISEPQEREGLFGRTLLISVLVHLLVLTGIVFLRTAQPKAVFTPLAVMDFSPYDPLGGNPGQEEASEEPPAPEPVSEPEPEPEPDPEPLPELVESQAEEAPVITPPPPEKKNPNPKPRPRRSPPPAPAAPAGPPGAGSGGSRGGTGRGQANLLGAYKSQISRRLNQYKKYPPEAMARQLSGIVRVSFRISSRGRISAVRMTASSGYGALDAEALALLKRCNPFPPIPEALGLERLELDVPIIFSVKR